MRKLLLLMLVVFNANAFAQGNNLNFGQPIATTVQLPTFGVSFDAEGVLEMKEFEDPGGRLVRQKLAVAQKRLVGNLAKPSKLRKVSLVRLEEALAKRLVAGQEPSEVMQSLAGLTNVAGVFCYPDQNDIVIAGPAEPWIRDLGNNPIGLASGRPILRLEDLVVALRVFGAGEEKPKFVGCTINPREEALAKLVAFQKRIPKVITDRNRDRMGRWIAEGVKESLGMANVVVMGISPQTNFARVMIEADYRMKRIAIGVEEPPIDMTTFAEALTTARNGALERWWFTPKYDGIAASPDRLAMKIVGQGVQLQTENKSILPSGLITDVGVPPTRAARTFANNFTKSYDKISKSAKVYGQLRQLMDLLVVAAFMQKHDWYQQAKWNADRFSDEQFYSVNTLNNPKKAPAVVNAFWKQRRFFSPAGGGVSIEAYEAMTLIEEDYALRATREDLRPTNVVDNSWWWD